MNTRISVLFVFAALTAAAAGPASSQTYSSPGYYDQWGQYRPYDYSGQYAPSQYDRYNQNYEYDQYRREERMREEHLRAEQLRAEQLRTEQLRAEQLRVERARADQARAEQIRLERARAEQSRVDQLRAEQNRAEQIRAEQIRAEQLRAARERRPVDPRVQVSRSGYGPLETAIPGEGAGPGRNIRLGDPLPRQYMNNVVEDWAARGLSQPAGSFQWFQVGNDYVQVNLNNGLIGMVVVSR